jgi:adenylate cyclase
MREGGIVELTVLFADLSKFTEITHDLGAEKTHEVVSTFLDMATNTLLQHGAFIDRYIGDAILAFFNVPAKQEDHIIRALNAACEIQKEIGDLRQRFDMDLQSSTGIATGWARVGSLGSTIHKDYSAIGEVVNLAARLEEAAQPGEVMVSAEVYEKVAEEFPDVFPQKLQLKGFRDPVTIYCLKGQTTIKKEPTAEIYQEPSTTIGLGETVFALLGEPCKIGTPTKPMTAWLGMAAVSLSAITFLDVFNTPVIQYPVFSLAAIASLANLYATWHSYKLRRQTGETPDIKTRFGRLRPALAIALSIATLLIIALGLYFDLA